MIGIAADIGWRKCAPREWRRKWGGRGLNPMPMGNIQMDDIRETLLEQEPGGSGGGDNWGDDSDGYDETVDGGVGGGGGLHANEEDPFAEVDQILSNNRFRGGGGGGGGSGYDST